VLVFMGKGALRRIDRSEERGVDLEKKMALVRVSGSSDQGHLIDTCRSAVRSAPDCLAAGEPRGLGRPKGCLK